MFLFPTFHRPEHEKARSHLTITAPSGGTFELETGAFPACHPEL